jgi:hypothetical protein
MFCALLSVERFFLLFRALFSAIPSNFFCYSEHFFVSRAIFSATPSNFFCYSEHFFVSRAIFSATPSTFLSVEHFFVIPSESEESSMDASLRLRSVQHDKRGVIPSTFLSFRAKRGIHCGFFIQMQKFFQMKVQFR